MNSYRIAFKIGDEWYVMGREYADVEEANRRITSIRKYARISLPPAPARAVPCREAMVVIITPISSTPGPATGECE